IEFKPVKPEIVRDIIPPLELEPPEEKPPPLPPTPVMQKLQPQPKEVDADYFLPKDYEITDDWPATPSQAPPRPSRLLSQPSSTTAIQAAAATTEPVFEQGYAEDTTSDRTSSRSRRRYDDDRNDRSFAPRRPPREDMRGKWPLVFWGVTLELVGLFVAILGLLVVVLGGVVAAGAGSQGSWEGMSGAVILLGVGSVMLGGQQILRLAGYGLCIASPMRTGARIWAILALVFSLLSAGAHFSRFVVGPTFGSQIGMSGGLLGIVAAFCFLICLRGIAVALKEHGLAEDIQMLIVWLGIFIGCFFVMFLVSVLISALAVGSAMRSRDPGSVSAGMGILGLLSCFFVFAMVIFGIVLLIRYVMILINVRSAIAYRIES
ncbi:MAG TPA: hypothetical protein VGZ47_18715, partial [Gemmataceae bacterium]|nr:hypothetical protein [Gemmataceae bacterium]